MTDLLDHLYGKEKQQGLYDISYSTGFSTFDYLNGYECQYYDQTGNKKIVRNLGIADGSFNMLVGRSMCGKTTWAIQAASNIISQFDNSNMIIFSIESGFTLNRLLTLTNFTEEELEKRVAVKNGNISSESVFEEIKNCHRFKLENKEHFLYDTGMRDYNGNPILKYKPTVIVLDSLAVLYPERVNESEDLMSNMDGAIIAKSNSSLVKKIIQLLKGANIILLAINHITEDINTSFLPKKGPLAFLKQGEKLPGGKAVAYLSNNIIRFDDSKIKEDVFGFGCSEVKAKLVKSRTNNPNVEVPLFLKYSEGFDNIMSSMLFLKERKRIVTKGAYMSLDNFPDGKFTNKKFKEKLADDKEFRDKFIEVLRQELSSLLGSDIITESDDIANKENKEKYMKTNKELLDALRSLG